MEVTSQAPVRQPPLQVDPLPESVKDRVALILSERRLYADRRTASDPILMTWQHMNKAKGININIVPCELDEVSRLRQSGQHVSGSGVDDDLENKNTALRIITDGWKYEASDIHFMMRGDFCEIQFVIRGGLRVYERLSQEHGMLITRAIYQGLAGVRSSGYKEREFQNAQISGDKIPDAGLTSVRIVRGPCYPLDADGSFMTMRLQYQSGAGKKTAQAEELKPLEFPRSPDGALTLVGYTPAQIAKIREMVDAPSGVILFIGPTGSGKTTSLYECLKDEAREKPHRRQVTIEDPIEYPMPWAVQMAVTEAANDEQNGEAFVERLRVALRMAPNTILVGEIRGPEVAASALEASLTGHKVLTTIHVTDPFLFVDRLELMDNVRLNRRVFCDHKIIRGAIAQRLLPKLCPDCSVPLAANPDVLPPRMLNALRTWGDIGHVRLTGPGCPTCNGDGRVSRFAVAEVVVMDSVVMADFIEHGTDEARTNYRRRDDADPSMLESAIQHVLAGIVDPRSVEDSVDLITPKGKD